MSAYNFEKGLILRHLQKPPFIENYTTVKLINKLSHVVIGGGAAGFFGACVCKNSSQEEVLVLEKSGQLLSKVRISGGGRCNVTHACFEPKELAANYPRGYKALVGPFYRFGPQQTIEWFQERGVVLKVEEDGRVFPTTDSSQTIIDCLTNEAKRLGVRIQTHASVEHIEKNHDSFVVTTAGEKIFCKTLLVATGSSRPLFDILKNLGHTIVSPVPSLFTFTVPTSPLLDLAGVSVKNIRASIEHSPFVQEGPLLLTHWGFSGPAIIKLSSWAARWLHDAQYKAALIINWVPHLSQQDVVHRLENERNVRRSSVSEPCFDLPKNLWKRFVTLSNISSDLLWNALSNAKIAQLAHTVTRSSFAIEGKAPYKEEFVTCGGVHLDEVDFKTMQSKIVPNLFFAGEVLDIDGITGGFNFQNAWTTSWIAGNAMAKDVHISC